MTAPEPLNPKRAAKAAPESTPADALDIADNVDGRRYEARSGGEIAGWVEYGRVGNRLVALHTEVLPAFEGRGIASALVRRVLADARAAGAKITPRCPFFVRHFERHPEDEDLIATPGRAGAAGDGGR